MSLKHRLFPAVQTVGKAVLPIEQAAHEAAVQAHRAVAVMIEQKLVAHGAGAPANFGADAIAQASAGANHLTLAANCLAGSHQALAGLLEDLGYGPQCPIGKIGLVDAA